ncbi:MAG: FTR1 family protein [Coriobacteriales bacterium]|nr:FTR1 family protein [Coriobacteriales bacterium]
MSSLRKITSTLLAAIMLVSALCLPNVALAVEGTYYATYAEWNKTLPEGTKSTWNDIVEQMDVLLETGKEAFQAGDMDTAYDAVNDAYYGWYETTGFERVAMGYIGNGRKSEVELAFATPKSVAKKNGSYDDYAAEVDELSAMLHEDANILDGTTGNSGDGESDGSASAFATFLACFSIIVREGVEAILIVGAIIAYLVKSGNKGSLKQVYIGAILGVVCSFIMAWLLNLLKFANAAPQEIIEGVTALLAVCVLYYVSNWMLSKSESEAWNAYIKNQVDSSVKKGSGFALAFTAWLAVFREGAEVILFYQPMLKGDNIGMVWAGFGVGCLVLVVLYVLVRYYSVRLPLKPFFRVMSIFMFVMAISFLGSGIKELIEGNVITMTPIPWIPSNEVLEVFGIYPCVETIVPQLILIVVTVFVYIYQVRKSKRMVEAARAEGGEASAKAEQ